MDGIKDVVKKGWHPEREGTSFKSQVTGMFRRDSNDPDRTNHVARPLSQLRDPASFAPPPRRNPSAAPFPSSPTSTAARPAPASPASPQRFGAAARASSSSTTTTSAQAAVESPRYLEQEEGVAEPAPRPYRMDMTGLSTAHLPPPPGRRDGAGGKGLPMSPPPPYQATATAGPPRLPPRLPPRASPGPPPPTQQGSPQAQEQGGFLNQGAVSRLGAAGISVPSLGIGRPSAAALPSSPPPPSRSTPASQMNELQSRFSRLGSPSSASAPSAPPTEGTTTAQKQAALRTAAAIHRDPGSVSVADARSAASTLNNFRQRHGDQVEAGVRGASSLNQKYGVADRVAGYGGDGGVAAGGQTQQQQQAAPAPSARALASALSASAALGKKKPAPPPPPKKSELGAAGQPAPTAEDEPPPLPMATKPRF